MNRSGDAGISVWALILVSVHVYNTTDAAAGVWIYAYRTRGD